MLHLRHRPMRSKLEACPCSCNMNRLCKVYCSAQRLLWAPSDTSRRTCVPKSCGLKRRSRERVLLSTRDIGRLARRPGSDTLEAVRASV